MAFMGLSEIYNVYYILDPFFLKTQKCVVFVNLSFFILINFKRIQDVHGLKIIPKYAIKKKKNEHENVIQKHNNMT